MHAHNGEGIGPRCTRRIHEIQIAHARRHRFRHADNGRDEDQGQRQNCIDNPRTKRARDRHRQQHGWEGVEHIRHPHDGHIGLAAGITRQHAQHSANHESECHGCDPHEPGKPPAIQQARQHIAAKFIRAQDVIRRTNWPQAPDHAALIGVMRRDQRRKHNREQHQQQDRRAEDCHRVAPHTLPDTSPIARGAFCRLPRLDREFSFRCRWGGCAIGHCLSPA